MKLLPLGLFALGLSLAGCPPNLTGEPCQNDCECPTSQTCVADGGAGACETGTNQCGSVSPDGGGQGLTGVVTLNGGAQKPTNNMVWVSLYANAADADAGTSPVFTKSARATGDFTIQGVVPGAAYYAVAQYDLDNDGNPGNPSHLDKFATVGPVHVSDSPIEIDVSTYSCGIFAGHAGQSSSKLFEAFADVPDVQSGLELTSGVTVTVTGSAVQTQTLSYQGASGDPFSNLRWAFSPRTSLDGGTAADPLYKFTVSGPFYQNAPCSVSRSPLAGAPTALAIEVDGGVTKSGAVWDSQQGASDTVVWTPAQGADFEVVTLRSPANAVSNGTVIASVVSDPGASSYTFAGNTVPKGLCGLGLVLGTCDCEVVSVSEKVVGNGVSLEGAFSDLPFTNQ